MRASPKRCTPATAPATRASHDRSTGLVRAELQQREQPPRREPGAVRLDEWIIAHCRPCHSCPAESPTGLPRFRRRCPAPCGRSVGAEAEQGNAQKNALWFRLHAQLRLEFRFPLKQQGVLGLGYRLSGLGYREPPGFSAVALPVFLRPGIFQSRVQIADPDTAPVSPESQVQHPARVLLLAAHHARRQHRLVVRPSSRYAHIARSSGPASESKRKYSCTPGVRHSMQDAVHDPSLARAVRHGLPVRLRISHALGNLAGRIGRPERHRHSLVGHAITLGDRQPPVRTQYGNGRERLHGGPLHREGPAGHAESGRWPKPTGVCLLRMVP